YQFESFNLFQEMMQRVRESFVEQFFRVRIISEDASLRRRGRELAEGRGLRAREPSAEERRNPEGRHSRFEESFAAGEGRPGPVRKGVRIGRNDLCPCGSGKKYKHCCGKGL
ncbi:MAG: SEC-C domain-containing protein, partial [Synergistaceae bacterium]|nr:SEC-C domain-containing protein [Synergistaceae bacterium]